MSKQRPRPQARGLSARLLAMRKATGLSSIEVAAKLGWSQSTISRIETGKRTVTPEEVIALLAIYGVRGDDREQLLEMSRHADRPNWLEESRNSTVPIQATLLAQYEAEAASISYLDIALIPGILQTRAYASAIMRAGLVPASHIEPRVDLRMQRQKLLLERPKAPRILSIVDEAAIRREVGGRRVMAEQLSYLAMQARRPGIEFRIIPFDCGAYPASTAPFVLLEFAHGQALIHIELRAGGLFLDDVRRIESYRDAAASLRTLALEPGESLRLLAEVAETYQRE